MATPIKIEGDVAICADHFTPWECAGCGAVWLYVVDPGEANFACFYCGGVSV